MTLTLTIWPLQAELIPTTALTSRLQPELSPPPQDPWTPMKDLLLQILCKVEFCLLQAAFCDLLGFYCPLRSPCRLVFWNPFIPLAHSPVVDRLLAGTERRLGPGLTSSGRLASPLQGSKVIRRENCKASQGPRPGLAQWPSYQTLLVDTGHKASPQSQMLGRQGPPE